MNLTASIRAEAFLARLSGSSDALAAEMRRVLNKLSIEAQAAVKSQKLSGQVLHVRSGTLRRSINRKVFEDATGFFAQVGTNVKYAAAHEYGFSGSVSVKSHVRKIRSKAAKPTKSGKGKESVRQVVVREHSRFVHLPERSFLRSTVKEMFPRIQQELKAAALRALK